MIRSNTKKAIARIRDYVVDNTSVDYENVNKTLFNACDIAKTGIDPKTGKEVDKFSVVANIIYTEFYIEVIRHNDLYNTRLLKEYDYFKGWAQGLPSLGTFNYVLPNIDDAQDILANILEETEEEKEKYTYEQACERLTSLIYREIKKVVG